MTAGPAYETVDAPEDLAEANRREFLRALSSSVIPFLVGGTYALRRYTNSTRHTKDLDVFVRPADAPRVLELFRRRGCRVELPFPHWLAKVYHADLVTDVIFSSGNGVATVDDSWFAHARYDDVCGVSVRLSPPEEMIWSKAFVQERERFDGADVLHLIRFLGASLDWTRLLQRFGSHWQVLLAHLVMFDFVYPDQRHQIPGWIVKELTSRFLCCRTQPAIAVCNGTLLSREQYLDDVQQAGYLDGRLEPVGRMTREEIDIWTAGIDGKS